MVSVARRPAPTNCVLEVLSVKVGDVLAPNQPVATLLLTNHIWVRVFVPEPWLGHIKLGDTVKVRVDSFPEKDFNGVVEQIAHRGRTAMVAGSVVKTADHVHFDNPLGPRSACT